MSSPEQLSRRVDRQVDDLRAGADTVVDLREIAEAHTSSLADIHTRLGALETRVNEGFSEIVRLLQDR